MVSEFEPKGDRDLQEALDALRHALETIDAAAIPKDIGALVDEAVQRLARFIELQI